MYSWAQEATSQYETARSRVAEHLNTNSKNIIFTSSIAVYGNQLFEKNETSKLYPDTPYGISKLISEKLFEKWQVKSKDRILTISRPGVVFGKDEKGNMERLKKLTNNIIFIFPGNKEIYKASIYIKELINQLFWVNKNADYCFITNAIRFIN